MLTVVRNKSIYEELLWYLKHVSFTRFDKFIQAYFGWFGVKNLPEIMCYHNF